MKSLKKVGLSYLVVLFSISLTACSFGDHHKKVNRQDQTVTDNDQQWSSSNNAVASQRNNNKSSSQTNPVQENHIATSTQTQQLQNSSANSNSSIQSTQQNNVPASVIYMLAYIKAYRGPNNIAIPDLLVSGNVIGQGTDDSTASLAITGNHVSLTIERQPSTYNINDLINEYYKTPQQKQTVHYLIDQGIKNHNQLMNPPIKNSK